MKLIDPVLEKYKNDGFGKNAFGWYFNPWIDEYDENYDPHNDEEYNEELNKTTKEIKWHPKLTKEQIEELIEEGLEPGDNEYNMYLWNHGINPFEGKETKQDGGKKSDIKKDGDKESKKVPDGDKEPKKVPDGDKEPKKVPVEDKNSETKTKPKTKYYIDFYANEKKYRIIYQDGIKLKNVEIKLDEIVSDNKYKAFIDKLRDRIPDFNIKGIDPYILYTIMDIDNKELFQEYMDSLTNGKNLESIEISYNMDGIYSRTYSKELSSDIMHYANLHEQKGLATVKKGRFTRFMESHPMVRGIWEKVSKIGAKKNILLPIATISKEEKLTDDVTILDDDIIIVDKKEKTPSNNLFKDLLTVKTEKLIKRVDELLGKDITEKDYDINITAEEAIAKADKVLKETEIDCK